MNLRGAMIIDGVQRRTWLTDAAAEDMEAVFEEMKETLPKIRRRTPKQRMESMWKTQYKSTVQGLLKELRLNGYATWPKSVRDQLIELSKRDHDPRLAKDMRSVEDVLYQSQAFNRWLTETGENEQKARDRKQVILGWHGH